MKPFLIGCGVILLLIIVFFVSCFGYIGYKTIQFTRGVEEGIQLFNSLEEDLPFIEPNPMVLSDERFQDFLSVRDQYYDTLNSTRFTSIYLNAEPGNLPDLSVTDGFRVLEVLTIIPKELGNALKSEEMSPMEFRYHIAALVMTLEEYSNEDAELAEIREILMEGAAEIQSLLQDTGMDQSINTSERPGYDGVLRIINRVYGDFTPARENIALIKNNREELTEKPRYFFGDLLFFVFYSEYREVQEKARAQQGAREESSAPPMVGLDSPLAA